MQPPRAGPTSARRIPLLRGGRVALWVALGLAAGCATTQSRLEFLGEHYPPHPADAPVALFRTGLPPVPFRRVARLDVHIEKTGFATSSFEEALPELRKEARQAGADAIIEVEERRSQVRETMVYHVTATGVRYGAPP
jgi:hypothetical protein